MEKPLVQIYQNLQRLVGLHRQLLDTVRSEKEVLIKADLSEIHAITSAKQALIESIHEVESERLRLTGELALHWRRPYRELTLPNIIIQIQGRDLKAAEQLRSVFNALTILIQRISEQNQSNRSLIEKSLEHVHQMKKNILGEAVPNSNTYNQQGQKASASHASRLISREA